MFVAKARRVIPASAETVWRDITVGRFLSQWFADSDDLGEGKAFRFAFGDGDFFSGRVEVWNPLGLLVLRWRFMGIGPEFDVRWTLRARSGGTEVAVTDRGALSREEAASLSEGWLDFLSRLERFAATGERTRYEWSETISAGIVLRRHREELPTELFDEAWLREHFAGARVEPHETSHRLRLMFHDPAWEGSTTDAQFELSALPHATYLVMTHTGWSALAPSRRIDERRRYARMWKDALAALEAAYE